MNRRNTANMFDPVLNQVCFLCNEGDRDNEEEGDGEGERLLTLDDSVRQLQTMHIIREKNYAPSCRVLPIYEDIAY